MLLKKDFEGGLRAILIQDKLSNAKAPFKKSAPMILLLRTADMPTTFSTASVISGDPDPPRSRAYVRTAPKSYRKFGLFR
jgi:hypothetical protein